MAKVTIHPTPNMKDGKLFLQLVRAPKSKPTSGALLKLQPLIRGEVEADGSAQLMTGTVEYDRAVILLILRQKSEDATPKILYKAQFDSPAAIPDALRVDLKKTGQGKGDNEDKPSPENDDIKPSKPKPSKPKPSEPKPSEPKPSKPNRDPHPDRPSRPLVNSQQPLPLANGLGEAMRRTHLRKETIAQSVSSQTQSAVGQVLERKKRARDLAQNALGQRPRRQSRKENFVAHNADPGKAMAQARKEGLDRLRQKGPRRGISLRSTENLKPGKIGAARLREIIAKIAPHQTVTRKAEKPTDCAKRKVSQNVQAEAQKKDGQSPNSADEPIEAVLDINQALANILNGSGGQSALENRPNQSDIAESLQNELVSGPADAPAYYDYPVLHVAWKDVWQAVLDGQVKSDIADLYNQFVDVVPPEYLPNLDDSDVAEVNELEDLLIQISGVATAVAVVTKAPAELLQWAGLENLSEHWSYLSTDDQDRLIVLKTTHDYCATHWYAVRDNFWIDEFSFATKEDKIETWNYAFWYETQDQNDGLLISFASGFTSNGYDSLPDDFKYGYYNDPIPASGKSWVFRLTYKDQTDAYLSTNISELSNINPAHLLTDSIYAIHTEKLALEEANRILASANTDPGSPLQVDSLGRAEDLINKLQKNSDRPYQFDVFAPDSYNFGLLTNYRQKWTPLAYQAGDLAGTIPLAPSETRSFTIKRTTKESVSRTNSHSGSSSSSTEFGSTSRIEGEISQRVNSSMTAGADIGASAEGGFLGNGGQFSASGSFGADMGNESNQLKKDLRETTRKMAQDYKDERKLEINVTRSSENEYTETRTISNPNNELTVTYLFYELQRRFEVSERLNDITPVILVAFKMPPPDAISEAWLLAHDWILKDVLLDRQLLPVFNMLANDFIGDELGVEILEEQWKTQMTIVSELRFQLSAHTELRDEARSALERVASDVANIPDMEGKKKKVGQELAAYLLGASNDEEAARQALDWVDLDLQKAEGGLKESIGALERATQAYLEAVKQRLNRRTQIDHLIIHIKENILHYMQEIWRREHPDQRYLRLYDLNIDWPGGGTGTFTASQISNTISPNRFSERPEIAGTINLDVPVFSEKRWLHEVADLSKILGFKGNYAVFRLKESNAFSDYMLQDYLDDYFGLYDPDHSGDVPTVEEAIEIAKCRWQAEDLSEKDKKEIGDWLVNAMDRAQAISQMVIVPTGELFIEALPGSHPVLEDFKLQHRAYDTQKAAADAKTAEVELLRRALRVQNGDTEDPDVDRIIRIEGGSPTINVDSE